MNPGPWGIAIVVVAVLLLFGRGKISGLMGEVAQGIKSFRKGIADDDTEVAEISKSKEKDDA